MNIKWNHLIKNEEVFQQAQSDNLLTTIKRGGGNILDMLCALNRTELKIGQWRLLHLGNGKTDRARAALRKKFVDSDLRMRNVKDVYLEEKDQTKWQPVLSALCT